jgi:hypothetical protein
MDTASSNPMLNDKACASVRAKPGGSEAQILTAVSVSRFISGF